MFSRHFLFVSLIALLSNSALAAGPGPVPFFPNPDVLLTEADKAYDDFFATREWKLKTIDQAGNERRAKYISTVVLAPPKLSRDGFYSWQVRYRFKDRYKAGGTTFYACRTADIYLGRPIFGSTKGWVTRVDVLNALDLSDDPCGISKMEKAPGHPAPDFILGIIR